MRTLSRYSLAIVICGFSFLRLAAQCPPRPQPDTVLQDALNLYSQNGVLDVALSMAHSVDVNGYTHYCYRYQNSSAIVEAPTLRLNPGDRLLLHVKDDISSDGP